ncbi:hypothetical protein DL98DRAFT_4 [Cadophora sp. DSE1049]|nr:hypothetical protein DL98DRAFT_4 [Cadophora sp. DSE1049]
MASQNFDFDLDRDSDGAVRAPLLQRNKFKKTGFFSLENPGFVLTTRGQEQILRESPTSDHNKHSSAPTPKGKSNDNCKSTDGPPARNYRRAAAKEVDGDGYEVDDSEDEDEQSEESEDGEGDSEWNDVD